MVELPKVVSDGWKSVSQVRPTLKLQDIEWFVKWFCGVPIFRGGCCSFWCTEATLIMLCCAVLFTYFHCNINCERASTKLAVWCRLGTKRSLLFFQPHLSWISTEYALKSSSNQPSWWSAGHADGSSRCRDVISMWGKSSVWHKGKGDAWLNINPSQLVFWQIVQPWKNVTINCIVGTNQHLTKIGSDSSFLNCSLIARTNQQNTGSLVNPALQLLLHKSVRHCNLLLFQKYNSKLLPD